MANFLDELLKIFADAKAYRDSLDTEARDHYAPVEDDCDDYDDDDDHDYAGVAVSVCVGDTVLIEDADKGVFSGVVLDFGEDEYGHYARIATDCYKRNRAGDFVKRVFRTSTAIGVERKGTKIVEVLS